MKSKKPTPRIVAVPLRLAKDVVHLVYRRWA